MTNVFGIILCAFCATLSTVQTATNLDSTEVVVLRYKTYYTGETSVFRSGIYEFRFCLCTASIEGNPEQSELCQCSSTVTGERVTRIPVVYTHKCITKHLQNRCLVAEIGPTDYQLSHGQLYVKVTIGNKPASFPEWQKLGASETVSRVQLTCAVSKQSCDNTCHTCATGVIELDYVTARKAAWSGEIDFRMRDVSDNFVQTKVPRRKTTRTRFNFLPKQSRNNRKSKSRKTSRPRSRISGEPGERTANRFGIDIREFRKTIVGLHNAHRSRHSVPALQTDRQMDKAAQKYADHLARQQGCLQHDKSLKYGENLYFFAITSDFDGVHLARDAVEAMYEEGRHYDYSRFRHGDYLKTGHFTQIIWKKSAKIGVGLGLVQFNGRKTNACQPNFAANMAYVVMKYDPSGNLQSESAYLRNVLPPT